MAPLRPLSVHRPARPTEPPTALRPLPGALVGAGLLLAACGEPMVDAGYRGAPLATFEGGFAGGDDRELAHRSDLRLALFWSPTGVASDDPEALVEAASSSRPLELPGDVVLRLWDAPKATERAGPDAAWALGRVLAYLDYDGDARRDADEPIVGGVGDLAIVWAASPLEPGVAPTRAALPAGFSLVALPLSCDGLPLAAHEGNCGVPLGAPCGGDDACGRDGVCLTDERFEWPDGACAIAEPTPSCRPLAAGFLPDPDGDPGAGYWVRGCADTCDQHGGKYACDVASGGCLPALKLKLTLGDALAWTPLCAAGGTP